MKLLKDNEEKSSDNLTLTEHRRQKKQWKTESNLYEMNVRTITTKKMRNHKSGRIT